MSTAMLLVGEIDERPVTHRQSITRPRPLWKRSVPVAAATILAIAITGAAAWWILRPSTAPLSVARFSLQVPEDQRLTTLNSRFVAISRDGTHVAYVANLRLYLRRLSELEAKAIPGTETALGLSKPTFSPDGQSIAFWSGTDRTIKRISVSGGATLTICPVSFPPFGMTWNDDGIVFGQGPQGVLRVSASGGTPERLVSVKDGELAHGPQVLPGNEVVLFTLATGEAGDRWDKAQVVVQSLKSGERKVLINGGSDAQYLPTGHLVYAFGGTLFAVPFDASRWR